MKVLVILCAIHGMAVAMFASAMLRRSVIRPAGGVRRLGRSQVGFHTSPRVAWNTSPEDQASYQRQMQELFMKIHERRYASSSLKTDEPQICDAIEFGEVQVLNRLLADPNYRVTDRDVWAAFGGLFGRAPDYQLLEALFRKGGNVDAVDRTSETWTMLAWAASQGNMKLIRFLVDHGVSALVPCNREGHLAERVALDDEQHFIAGYLKDYRESYLQDPKKAVNLIEAIRFGRLATAYRLLATGSYDREAVDKEGNDALWMAVGYPVGNEPNYHLVRMLIRTDGFDPKRTNLKSPVSTLQAWAVLKGDERLQKMLGPAGEEPVMTAPLAFWMDFESKMSREDFVWQESGNFNDKMVAESIEGADTIPADLFFWAAHTNPGLAKDLLACHKRIDHYGLITIRGWPGPVDEGVRKEFSRSRRFWTRPYDFRAPFSMVTHSDAALLTVHYDF